MHFLQSLYDDMSAFRLFTYVLVAYQRGLNCSNILSLELETSLLKSEETSNVMSSC